MSPQGDTYDVDDPGVAKAEGESWEDVADRRPAPESCPACHVVGDGDEVLAHGQRWCANGDCDVVSYREGETA
ncbi:hypothetical protein ACFQL1_01695 [Halomicroarcula sp. GCM10025709]|uniref:hypothetical protein n=1 Tax=Haloarcula TaxID=2237 RepID=UPI0024C20CC0|nr:hypothetical protein [Halomicroarcula sp. YJ-61-S]